MFCKECGTKLPEEANFCFHCGTKVSNRVIGPVGGSKESAVQLIQLVCPSCGGSVECNAKETRGICNHCGSTFLIRENRAYNSQTASNTVNIGLGTSGESLTNHIKRGQEFENQHNFDKATKYYNKALDIDYHNKDARAGLARIKLVETEEFIRSELYSFAKDAYEKIINSEFKVCVEEAQKRLDAIQLLMEANYQNFTLWNYEKAIEIYKSIEGTPAMEYQISRNIEKAENGINNFIYLSSVIDTSNIGEPKQLLLRIDGIYEKNLVTKYERKYRFKAIKNLTTNLNGELVFEYNCMPVTIGVKQAGKFARCTRTLMKGEKLERSKTKVLEINGVTEYTRES